MSSPACGPSEQASPLIEAVDGLRSDFPGLAVRVGVHSGETVIADMGAGDNRQLRDVVGDTPNMAARIQGIADDRHDRGQCECP